MSEKHRYIPISKVQPGMVLANELLDKQGQVLLPKDFVLTEKTITSLLHHDIHQLSIYIEELAINNVEENESLQQKKMRLNIILRHGPFEEPRNSLANLIKKYRFGDVKGDGDLQ